MANVNFDMGRFGIDIVASPRHADGLILSGPISANMAEALALTYEGMPDPKFVIAVGACAISGGVFANSPALDRKFLDRSNPICMSLAARLIRCRLSMDCLTCWGHDSGTW